jgi:hypothetical protein
MTLASLIVVGLLIAPLLLGGVLLILGWRGRRTDDHPLCRRCGFDLTGKPPDSSRCAECGADLLAKRATRVGHRHRRPVMAVAGLAMILATVGAGVWWLYPILSSTNPAALKPTWWLLADVRFFSGSARADAAAELSTRLAVNKLTAAQVSSAVDLALKIQADARQAWCPQLGDLVEAAERVGQVTPRQWRSYLHHLVGDSMTLVVRPRVQPGEELAAALSWTAVRGASSGSFPGALDTRLLIDGRPVWHGTHAPHAGVTGGPVLIMRNGAPVMLPPGRPSPRYVQNFPVRITARDGFAFGPHVLTADVVFRSRMFLSGEPDPQNEKVTFDASFDLLPPGAAGSPTRPAQNAALDTPPASWPQPPPRRLWTSRPAK